MSKVHPAHAPADDIVQQSIVLRAHQVQCLWAATASLKVEGSGNTREHVHALLHTVNRAPIMQHTVALSPCTIAVL